jgi:hypothetical protein
MPAAADAEASNAPPDAGHDRRFARLRRTGRVRGLGVGR